MWRVDVMFLKPSHVEQQSHFSLYESATVEVKLFIMSCLWILENVDMKDDELTKKGFIELNQMEADDNQGDVEDLWVTLNFMGYNKMLEMDEVSASLYKIIIY